MHRGRLRGAGRAAAVAAVGAAGALVVVVGLTGCTGEPADPPPTTPVTSSSASPSPTPTPTPTPDAAVPPERPDMSRVDAETAEAVAVYFLELYPYVYATGDLTEWRALSHPECIFCASVITNVEEMVAQGNRADGGLIRANLTVTDLGSGNFAAGGSAEQEPGFEYDDEGGLVESTPGGSYEVAMRAIGASTGWSIRAVEFREVEP